MEEGFVPSCEEISKNICRLSFAQFGFRKAVALHTDRGQHIVVAERQVVDGSNHLSEPIYQVEVQDEFPLEP